MEEATVEGHPDYPGATWLQTIDRKILGEGLQTYRKRCKVTGIEIAKILKISRQAYSEIERKGSGLTQSKVFKIVEIINKLDQREYHDESRS